VVSNEEFIYSLQKVNGKSFKLADQVGGWKASTLYKMASFLILLIFGMRKLFSVSRILDYFLERMSSMYGLAFFGMILGSISFIGRTLDIGKKNLTAGIVWT